MDYLYDGSVYDGLDLVVPNADLRRHLAALRLRDAQTVTLFNGKGLRASCTLMGSPADGMLRINSTEQTKAPSPLTLAIGLLDSRDRFEFAVEKATELGVTTIVLLASDHSMHLRATPQRLSAKVIAACEQSGRLWIPVIEGPMSLEEFLSSTTADVLLLGDQLGARPHALSAHHVGVLVGPEGGFSQKEQTVCSNDSRVERWAVGKQRLRAETAAIAMVAAVCVHAR